MSRFTPRSNLDDLHKRFANRSRPQNFDWLQAMKKHNQRTPHLFWMAWHVNYSIPTSLRGWDNTNAQLIMYYPVLNTFSRQRMLCVHLIKQHIGSRGWEPLQMRLERVT